MLHKKMAPLNLKQRDEFFMQCAVAKMDPYGFHDMTIMTDMSRMQWPHVETKYHVDSCWLMLNC